jgi:photosystem II stability/assembly factor-like uncharacterized protein
MAVHGSDLWFSVTTAGTQSNQLLVASSNSGTTFTTSQSPCYAGLGGTIDAASPSVLWAVCPTGMLAEVFRSTDGGVHWSPLKSAGELGNSTQLAPASATTAVLEQGSQSPVLRTEDGGTTWQTVYPSANGAWYWNWIGFTDSGTGSALRSEANAPANWPWSEPGAALAQHRRRSDLERAGELRLVQPWGGMKLQDEVEVRGEATSARWLRQFLVLRLLSARR